MSTNFIMKNINNKAIPTVRQILEIGQTISQYDVSKDSEDYNKFLDTKLDEIEFVLLGQEGVSARGFEISFEKEIESFWIRVCIPCSINDFNVAFNFIRNLGNYLENTKVTTDDEEAVEYDINTIEKYPYKEDIMNGIKQMKNIFKQNDIDTLEIYSIHRTVSFDEKMFTEVLNSDNPVEKFSKIITDIQYLDAFSANQNLYKSNDSSESGSFGAIKNWVKGLFKSNESSIFGVYVLTETVPTILPYKPVVEYQYYNVVKNEDVKRWEIRFIGINGNPEDSSYEMLGVMEYSEFIKKLPKEKYKFIDANNILVEALNRKEMENLLS